jgi:hypothetical protein
VTAVSKFNDTMGFKDSPLKGYATTTATSAALGALVAKLMGLRGDRGAALGVLGGSALSVPFIMNAKLDKDIKARGFDNIPRPPFFGKQAGFPYYDANTDVYNRPIHSSGSYLDSPIVPGAMAGFLADRETLDGNFRKAVAASMAHAGASAASAGRNEVTIGDIARAGVQAGLGGVGGFVLGTFLGSKNPGTWGMAAGALTGAYSLGKSFGALG